MLQRGTDSPSSLSSLTWGLVVEDGLGGFGRQLLGGGHLLLLGLAEVALAGLGVGGRLSGPPPATHHPLTSPHSDAHLLPTTWCPILGGHLPIGDGGRLSAWGVFLGCVLAAQILGLRVPLASCLLLILILLLRVAEGGGGLRQLVQAQQGPLLGQHGWRGLGDRGSRQGPRSWGSHPVALPQVDEALGFGGFPSLGLVSHGWQGGLGGLQGHQVPQVPQGITPRCPHWPGAGLVPRGLDGLVLGPREGPVLLGRGWPRLLRAGARGLCKEGTAVSGDRHPHPGLGVTRGQGCSSGGFGVLWTGRSMGEAAGMGGGGWAGRGLWHALRSEGTCGGAR